MHNNVYCTHYNNIIPSYSAYTNKAIRSNLPVYGTKIYY